MTIKEFKQKLECKFWNVSNRIQVWWSQNKDWAIVVIPSVSVGATWLLKKVVGGAITNHNLNKEKALKELYIYDMSLKAYWKLRRALSASEMLEIESRRKAGESLGEILRSMRLLK